jgi:hypothetical protein
LLAEVTRAREAATATEAAHVAAVLAAETSTQEAAVARDITSFCVKDAEDQAILAEGEALERVSRVEAENTAALGSAHEEVKGLVQKIILLKGELAAERRALKVSEREHREQFKELTLL